MTRYPQPMDKSVNNLWKTQAGPVGLSGGLIQIQPRITSKISIISNPCGGGVCCHCITEAMP